LVISNGGAVYGKSVFLDADNGDSALVTDTGSVWSVSGSLTVGVDVFDNSVTVANGAALSSIGGSVEGLAGCSVLVSDPGSVWHNSGDLSMGYMYGLGSSVVVSNGAAVYNVNASVGAIGYGSDTVSVNGPGSLWCNSGNLSIGLSRANNQLAVTDGGTVLASNVYVYGGGPNSYGNEINISDGSLYVTNALGNATLELLGGALALNGGTVTVDSLVVTNGSLYGAVSNNIVSFTGGTLSTKATTVNDGFLFTVGDGTHAATLTLASGGSGFHSFANGLSISSNAMLNGIGTIIGATAVNAGGVLSPGDGPGSITFSNNLTLATGSTFAVSLNGAGPGQYDQIIGFGPISIGNSILSVSLGYKPSPGDSFTIISNLTSTAILGTFVTTDGLALPNGAEFVEDGTTFQLDYAANADGMDVTLMALVPEPSTCFLVAIGLTAAFGFRRRCQRCPSQSKSV
jgi:T5SS/PEP-CTERM-associated repeat protein